MRYCAIVVLVSSIGLAACNQSGTRAAQPETGAQVGATAAVAEAPAPPAFEEVTVPAGTKLALVLDTAVASDTSTVEAPVRAHLAKAVVVNGVPVLPSGSVVSGAVADVDRAGKVKGRAHLTIRFHELTPAGGSERHRIETSAVSRTARATKGKDAAKVGAGAVGGAIVGGIIGGKKGAAIGSAAGAGAGGAVVMSTRGEEVRLGPGAAISVRLSQPITVRVPRS